ncbi:MULTISPECIES: ABC transporter substrate-binding protein [unclassified Paenibacillus]|uniref:ABC transporter substrate-binding protein n=1 Tax=unclassified Paenibacillus TaxID=185978 RepID=UPI001C126091|nr:MULTISPECIES: extracellular solute-binding protein [unclassified Paenibacillus]MBU5440762.1 extracellular solute-binding protein [Paenibacillus sp. MSJ-34]CAH0120382.1 hypothetical protein PAE9249_02901 [Paenibacillus sp. CECT 9249]
MRVKQIYKMFVIALCIALGGCTLVKPEKSAEPRRLKIMYYSEDYFYQEYGDLFSTKYPNIEVQVVDYRGIDYESEKDGIKAETNFINKEQPDVVLLSAEQYELYAADGMLLELDSFIRKENYDIDGIYPTIIDLLKEKGGGKLYGLSPRFYGNALFYNADLFAKYGVELPHDKMTWQEILELARRFPADGDEKERVYGFGLQGSVTSDRLLDTLASSIAYTQGLTTVNPGTLKVTANTDSWRNVWKMALEAANSGAIYSPKEDFWGGSLEEYYLHKPFLMGRMAMTVDDSYLLQNIKQVKERIKAFKPFQLGIAAGPVDPFEPDSSRDIQLQEIFAIRAGSPNSDAAWEFIKYVNGVEYAKIKSRTMNGNLLSRMGSYKEEYAENGLEAFYALKPKTVSNGRESDIPNEFYPLFEELTKREIQRVQAKETTLDEALDRIQAEGQTVLDRIVKADQS